MEAHEDGDLWKGLLAGVAGGLAATVAMTGFHALLDAWTDEEDVRRSHHPQHSVERGQPESARQEEDDATVRAASALGQAVLGRPLTQREKEVGGPALHYGFGIVTGGLYGALAEVAPAVTRGAGLPFGVLVWLLADAVTVPVLGLADPPHRTPPSVHARALGAHLVYGLGTELARRTLRNAL